MTEELTPWVLVTGNGAFGETAQRKELEYADNPSSRIALTLDAEVIAGHRIVGVSLGWGKHPEEALLPLLDTEHPPVAVISLGVFSGRTTVSVERVAVNVQDFQFADNGYRPAGTPVFDSGPAAYFATLPVKAITQGLREAGIPALISNSASTHGCNSVMYTSLHLLTTGVVAARTSRGESGPILAGFIHLPDLPAHVARLGSNGPSMALEMQTDAIRIAIEKTIEYGRNDLDIPANEWEW